MQELIIYISDEAYKKLLNAQIQEDVSKSYLINELIMDCLGDE